VLNTGRIRDQWHTMTRSGRSARLASHLAEPFVDMNAADALLFGARDGNAGCASSTRWGRLVARLRTSGEIRARARSSCPFTGAARTRRMRAWGALVGPGVDPISGEPEFKNTPAPRRTVRRQLVRLRADPRFVVARGLELVGQRRGRPGFRRYEIAGRSVPHSWSSWGRSLVRAESSADWVDYEGCQCRKLIGPPCLRDDRLEACLFVSPQTSGSFSIMVESFVSTKTTPWRRASVLGADGRPQDPRQDLGVTVCACFGVGCNAIEAAIARRLP